MRTEERARKDGTMDGNSSPLAVDWKRELGLEARMYAASEVMNILQLGRVLQTAKEKMPHGEWGAWVQEYTEMSMRSAQQHMQAYAAFGLNADIAALGKGKIFKLMALPAGDRESFMEAHEVESMTVREIDETIKAEREKAAREIETERAARRYAERRLQETLEKPAETPPEALKELQDKEETIQEQAAEIQRLSAVGSETLEELNQLRMETDALRQQRRKDAETIEEQAAMLEEQQEAVARAQAELLDTKSAIARGDAERAIPDRMTAEAFAEAVNQFLGRTARIPQMKMRFAQMTNEERQDFEESLRAVEAWAASSRRALDTVGDSGVVA